MGFKINKSIIQGTDAHRGNIESSVLKSRGYAEAKKANPNLDKLIKARKQYQKGSDEYKTIQNQINKAYGVSKRHTTKARTTGKVGAKAAKGVIGKTSSNITSKTKNKTSKGSTSFMGKNQLEGGAGAAGTAYLTGLGVKSKTGQKALSKVGLKGLAKGGSKLAARAIPGLGWALAAYDVGKLGYYSYKKGSLKEGLKELGKDYGIGG